MQITEQQFIVMIQAMQKAGIPLEGELKDVVLAVTLTAVNDMMKTIEQDIEFSDALQAGVYD